MPKYNGMTATDATAAGNYKLHLSMEHRSLSFEKYKLHLSMEHRSLSFEKDHISQGVENAILHRWLKSDAPTRTYLHLIKCLKQSRLGALAD